MGTNVTLTNLIADIRARGEFRSGYIDDTTLTRWINASIASLWDVMIEGDSSSIPVTVDTSTITVVSGTASYALPADFYHLLRVDVADGTGWCKLDRFNLSDYAERADSDGTATAARYEIRGSYIWFSPTPTWSETVRLSYVPVAPTLSAGSPNFDSRNLWTEYVILDCLVKCGGAEENEMVGVWMKERDRLQLRILGRAQPDHGDAPCVVSVTGWGRSIRDSRDALRRSR